MMIASRRIAVYLSFAVLAACSGGGGATAGAGGPVPVTANGGSPSSAASHAPGTTASNTPTQPAPTATPSAASGTSSSAMAAPTAPPDAPGYTNVVPATPANGTCRAGTSYSIYVSTPTGDTEAFTVFEPLQLCGGKTYPLVMWGPGYSSSRETSDSQSAVNSAMDVASPGNIASLVNANYGVVSIDERGFGEDGGTVRVMDPNYEGLMDLSVMDWAQAKLNWIAYGPTLEGDDPHEPIMGAIGGSYGGMYQKMLLNIDKRHRFHAIAPQISPNDLNYSLFPNGEVKSAWDLDLFGLGETGGSTTTGYAHEDPFLQTAVTGSIEANAESQAVHDFFGYHSSSYFCNQQAIATDGNAGSSPLFAPTYPPKINALIFQGIRDTLFTLNNAYGDYKCWQQGGGDVRLLSYTFGHNALQVVPDPYVTLYYSATDPLNKNCGSTNVDTATVAFFDQYLKGIAGAASAIPTEPCLALGNSGTGVLVPSVVTGTAGTKYAIPSTLAVAGSAPDVPIPVTLGPPYTASATVAGLPYLQVDIEPTASGLGEPILFFGIGQMHANKPGAYDLLDNQLTPVRGVGMHTLDMTGIAASVAPGDQLALLIYGEEDQYDATGSINIASPAVVPVTVTGNVYLPLTSAIPAP
jgi:ABC-2 type transport system ATP-binding protein